MIDSDFYVNVMELMGKPEHNCNPDFMEDGVEIQIILVEAWV